MLFSRRFDAEDVMKYDDIDVRYITNKRWLATESQMVATTSRAWSRPSVRRRCRRHWVVIWIVRAGRAWTWYLNIIALCLKHRILAPWHILCTHAFAPQALGIPSIGSIASSSERTSQTVLESMRLFMYSLGFNTAGPSLSKCSHPELLLRPPVDCVAPQKLLF